MANQFTGCQCGAPTPDRCICEAMDRVVANSGPVTVSRPDGRWIHPPTLLSFLREHNPDRNTPAVDGSGVKVMADGGRSIEGEEVCPDSGGGSA